jgi:hypothetical protein
VRLPRKGRIAVFDTKLGHLQVGEMGSMSLLCLGSFCRESTLCLVDFYADDGADIEPRAENRRPLAIEAKDDRE